MYITTHGLVKELNDIHIFSNRHSVISGYTEETKHIFFDNTEETNISSLLGSLKFTIYRMDLTPRDTRLA